MHSRIAGTGGYLPAQIVTNADLAQRIDTDDEWVRTRTGICQRHIAAPGEQTSDLALVAAQRSEVHGRELTPFLLSRMALQSGGLTLKANISLLENNARVGAEIARALAAPVV